MPDAPEANARWTRILTRQDFVDFCADRLLHGDGITFVLCADGRLHGRVGDSVLDGKWHWKDGLFCRTARLDDEDLGLDCEIIERCGPRMRYTRDAGRGDSSVVEVTAQPN